MLKIVDRYILWEHLKAFIFGLGVFLAIFLVDLLMELIELIVTKNVPLKEVIRLFTYAIPSLLILVFPMATLLSTLVVFGKMSSDTEVTALKACGISLYRMLIPVLCFAMVVSGASFVFNEIIVPRANEARQDILRKITFKRPLPRIAENVFFDAGESRTFFVHKYDEETREMRDVLMYEFVSNAFPRIIVADTALWRETSWIFVNGTIYKFDTGGEEWHEIKFNEMELPVKSTYGKWDQFKSKRPHEMAFDELKAHIAQLRGIGIDTKPLLVQLYTKIALPFASFFFVLVGAPLAVTTRRSGKSIGVGMSILVIFFYYLLMSAGRALGEGGSLPPYLAAWIPNIVVGGIGMGLVVMARK